MTTTAPDELTAARQRIATAYDPCLLEDAGHRLAVSARRPVGPRRTLEGPVLPWAEPSDGIREAAALLHAVGPTASLGDAGCNGDSAGAGPIRRTPADHFARLVKIMLERGLNLHDPRYIGHQVPAPVPHRRAVRRRRFGHQPGDGHLRDGSMVDGGGAGHDPGTRRASSAGRPTPSPGPSRTAARWPTSRLC